MRVSDILSAKTARPLLVACIVIAFAAADVSADHGAFDYYYDPFTGFILPAPFFAALKAPRTVLDKEMKTARLVHITTGLGDFLDLERVQNPVHFSVGSVVDTPFGHRPMAIPRGTGTNPNDVTAIFNNSGGLLEAQSDLFVAATTYSPPANPPIGTNITVGGPASVAHGPTEGGRANGPGAFGLLGLVQGDNINSLSFGLDGTTGAPGRCSKGGECTQLHFSVDPDAVGKRNTHVLRESNLHQAAGDLFSTGEFDPFGKWEGEKFVPPLMNVTDNRRTADESFFGLAKSPAPTVPLFGPYEDDHNATELRPDMWFVAPSVYFTLDQFSQSVLQNLANPSDILRINLLVPDAPFEVLHPGFTMGLFEDDVIDALALSVTDIPDPTARAEVALFSLAPGSPSLVAMGLSPGDVFITVFNGEFGVYASAGDLGLLFTDNLNALDTAPVIPAPASATVLLMGAIRTLRRRQRAKAAVT